MSSPDQHGVEWILQSGRSQDPQGTTTTTTTTTKAMSTSVYTLLSELCFSSTGMDQCLPQLESHEPASSIIKREDTSASPQLESYPSPTDLPPRISWTPHNDSQKSPILTIDPEQIWSLGSIPPPRKTSPSPTLETQSCISASTNIKPSIQSSDLGQNGSARDHPLYRNASPSTDGLYHCPWEGQDGCHHQPDKLKCTYDKFVDSHLKPYRCRDSGCSNMQFSSTACLLRHERESHSMHGHGSKHYFCSYEGCNRAIPGNGFPRLWNLRDHMRRIHNDKGASACRSDSRQTRQPKRRGRPKSLPVTNPPGANDQDQQSHTEDWKIHKNTLEDLLGQLNQPDPQTSRLIKNAQVHLVSMKAICLNISNEQKRHKGC